MSQAASTAGSKRMREDDESGTPDANPQQLKKFHGEKTKTRRDEEFWFEDGSIALVARNIEFRVYMRVLADHSTVFANMLSFPQPASNSDTSSPKCPVVDLDDSPEDLRHVLRALFPRKDATFIPLKLEEPTYHLVSAYARLGHKYQMDGLLGQALAWLKMRYTTDLDSWYAQDNYPFGEESCHALGVVKIARLTQSHTILPTALMVCCAALGPKALLFGIKREDGTQEELDKDDLLRCLSKKRELMQASAKALLTAFERFHTPCCDYVGECQEGVRDLLHLYVDDLDLVANEHPFSAWDHYADSDYLSQVTICDPCLEQLRQRVRSEHLKVWKRLPEILDLGEIEGWPSGPD